MKQLIVRVPNKVHTVIKIEAAKRELSINELFLCVMQETKIITKQDIDSEK